MSGPIMRINRSCIWMYIRNGIVNVRLSELKALLSRLEFECRIKKEYFIYYKHDILEIINVLRYYYPYAM